MSSFSSDRSLSSWRRCRSCHQTSSHRKCRSGWSSCEDPTVFIISCSTSSMAFRQSAEDDCDGAIMRCYVWALVESWTLTECSRFGALIRLGSRWRGRDKVSEWAAARERSITTFIQSRLAESSLSSEERASFKKSKLSFNVTPTSCHSKPAQCRMKCSRRRRKSKRSGTNRTWTLTRWSMSFRTTSVDATDGFRPTTTNGSENICNQVNFSLRNKNDFRR